jgi:hypothetical protein
MTTDSLKHEYEVYPLCSLLDTNMVCLSNMLSNLFKFQTNFIPIAETRMAMLECAALC